MATTNKVGYQPLDLTNIARTGSVRSTRAQGNQFENRLGGERQSFADDARLQSDMGEHAAATNYLSDAAWAREETLEELKTLARAIKAGITDPWQLTDIVFYARHPEMISVPLTKDHQPLLDEWNSISALLVHPALNEMGNLVGANLIGGEVNGAQAIKAAFDRAARSNAIAEPNAPSLNERPLRLGRDNVSHFDSLIAQAVEWCPGLSPAVLKSLLAQESNFDPTVINRYGYAGIAQFGRAAAREVGLYVGIAGSDTDERLNPSRAIPAAARLLNLKAQRLGEVAFSRYGQPNGGEFWKFVVAAYNGGEATIALAMGHAYRNGLQQARALNLVGTEAVSFARNYASKWENLKIGGVNSPLGLAAARYFPNIAAAKYIEIGNYPTQIMGRVIGARN